MKMKGAVYETDVSTQVRRPRISDNALKKKSRTFLESAPDATIIVNKLGRIALVNSQTEKLFGYKRKELTGKDFELLIPQVQRKLNPDNHHNFFGNPQSCRLEASSKLNGVRKNGKKFSLDISLSPLQIGNEVYAWVAVRDITEWQQIEDDSKITQAYTRSLIEASLDPLVTISPTGKITDVNEASVKLTGVPREKLIGTDFSDYFTEPKKAREGYKQVFDKGFVSDYPLTVQRHGGKLIDVLYNASVYRDKVGNVLGVFAAARDVTVQEQASQYARSLIEASLDPLVTVSPDGKITDVNEASVKLTGVTRENLIGTDFSDYFTEPKKAREVYEQVFDKGFVS